MDFVRSLFGAESPSKRGRAPLTRLDQGDQFRTRLAATERTYDQRVANIESRIKLAKQKAFEANKAGKREEAKIHLRRVGLLQNQLKTLHGYSSNNAILASQAESTQMALENVELMKEGVEYQKSLMAEMGDVDDVEETILDVKDVIEDGQEIIDIVSKPFDLGGIIPNLDDDALDAAMDELEAEQALEINEVFSEIVVPRAETSSKQAPKTSEIEGEGRTTEDHLHEPTGSVESLGGSVPYQPPPSTSQKKTTRKGRYTASLALLDD